MVKVYLRIDGDDFDADSFQREAGGTIDWRKRIHNGRVELCDKYWMSSVVTVEAETHPEDALLKLLEELKTKIAKLANAEGIRRTAEIVEYIDDDNPARGWFFSVETLGLLAELSFELDIDVVETIPSCVTRI